MKSPNDSTPAGRSNPEHRRPMSCRGSAMQQEIAAAVRRAAPEQQTPGNRQSWRVQGVITGTQPACPTLESVIDERIAAGATAEDVMEIAHTVVRNTRRKLIESRPEFASLCAELDAAYAHEEAAQGRAGVSQIRVIGKRCMSSLRTVWRDLTHHRDALDMAIIATEREIAERETKHSSDLGRFGLRPNGRAS